MKPNVVDLGKEYQVNVNFIDTLKVLKNTNQAGYKTLQEFMSMNVDSLMEGKKLTFRLFDMYGAKKISEVNTLFTNAGYCASEIIEVLAFVNSIPEFQKLPIVAFASGRSFNNGGDRYTPTVSEEDGKQLIGFGCFGYNENNPCCLEEKISNFYFLGTKIENKEE